MAQGNYESGFSLGYKASKPIGIEELGQRALSISEEVKNQERIGKERQEAFDKARQEFKDKQIEENKSFIYEDQFVETGLEDFDAAGELLRKSVKDSFETNMFAYNSGAISENEAKRRNAVTVGHVKEMAGVYDKAKASLEMYEKLEDEGKGSAANDIKRQALEDFFKNFRVSPGEVGLDMYTVTVENGVKKVVKLPAKQFNDLFNFGQGVDLENDLKSIVKEVGSDTYIKGNTKIQSWLKDEGKLDQATTLRFDAIVEGYSDNQIIDAAKKLKTTSSGEISVEKLNDEDLLSKLKTEVKQGMIDTVKEELKLKQSSIPFIPTVEKDTPTQKVEKDIASAVYSNVYSLFSKDPEVVDSALQNLESSNKDIKKIFRTGKDKITIQYKDPERSDSVVSLSDEDEKGFNINRSALSLTTEILSNSMKNSIDISQKAQNQFNSKNGIPDENYTPDFNDFGDVELDKSVLELKGTVHKTLTLDSLLDSESLIKYEDAVKTFLASNKVPLSNIRIERISPSGFGSRLFSSIVKGSVNDLLSPTGDALNIEILGNNGEIVKKYSILPDQNLQEKINTLQTIAKDVKKSGFGIKESTSNQSQQNTLLDNETEQGVLD
jgi:hypothetical protein